MSYPGEASSGALAGKERQIRARVLARAAGMLRSSRPPAAYVLSQFLLPLLRPKVGRRGKGTFLPCNPELLPRHLERGRSPGSPSARWLLAPCDRAEPGTELAVASHPPPRNCLCKGRGHDPRGCPLVCSRARSFRRPQNSRSHQRKVKQYKTCALQSASPRCVLV